MDIFSIENLYECEIKRINIHLTFLLLLMPILMFYFIVSLLMGFFILTLFTLVLSLIVLFRTIIFFTEKKEIANFYYTDKNNFIRKIYYWNTERYAKYKFNFIKYFSFLLVLEIISLITIIPFNLSQTKELIYINTLLFIFLSFSIFFYFNEKININISYNFMESMEVSKNLNQKEIANIINNYNTININTIKLILYSLTIIGIYNSYKLKLKNRKILLNIKSINHE